MRLVWNNLGRMLNQKEIVPDSAFKIAQPAHPIYRGVSFRVDGYESIAFMDTMRGAPTYHGWDGIETLGILAAFRYDPKGTRHGRGFDISRRNYRQPFTERDVFEIARQARAWGADIIVKVPYPDKETAEEDNAYIAAKITSGDLRANLARTCRSCDYYFEKAA